MKIFNFQYHVGCYVDILTKLIITSIVLVIRAYIILICIELLGSKLKGPQNLFNHPVINRHILLGY